MPANKRTSFNCSMGSRTDLIVNIVWLTLACRRWDARMLPTSNQDQSDSLSLKLPAAFESNSNRPVGEFDLPARVACRAKCSRLSRLPYITFAAPGLYNYIPKLHLASCALRYLLMIQPTTVNYHKRQLERGKFMTMSKHRST